MPDQAKEAPARSRWGQARRLEFIDVRLRWAGRINRSDLVGFFGMSVPQASLDIARYMDVAPQNVRYDASSKTYVATEDFSPAIASADPHRYLGELLVMKAGLLGEDQAFLGWLPPFDTVPTPERRLPASLFFEILKAIREQQAIDITYQSMNHIEPTQRTISPHALGHDGFRWHARAYCHTRNQFIDFVIARILKTEITAQAAVSGETDEQWHRVLRLVLKPNPALSPEQQLAIALDYEMEQGSVEYSCRQALLFYALRRLGLDHSQDAKAQHIVLANREEIQPYLTS